MPAYTPAGQSLIQENLNQFLLVLSVSLGVISLSRFFTQFREIPYSIVLVVTGLILAIFNVHLVTLSPAITLFIFLPSLLFVTAWNIDWPILRRNLIPIGLYAIGGSFLTIAGVSYVLTTFAHFSINLALVAGACLAAISPTPVILLFRQLGVEQRLTTLAQSENLFSACVAIEAFVLITDPAIDFGSVDLTAIALRIVLASGIGLLVGGISGLGIAVLLRRRSDVPFLGRSLLLACAYGSYLIAEDLGGSGAIAVLVAGVIVGNVGVVGMDSFKQDSLSGFLNFAAFFVNSIVFLLIGNQIDFNVLLSNGEPIVLAISAVLLARAVSIYGFGSINQWLTNSPLSWQEQTLLWWTGLRGSLSIALALSVPIVLVRQEAIQSMVFGVVLFTLLVQGLTTKTLLSRLGVLKNDSHQEEYTQGVAKIVALSQTLTFLGQAHVVNGWRDEAHWVAVQTALQQQLTALQTELSQLEEQHPDLQALDIKRIYQVLVSIEASTYAQFVRAGLIRKKPLPMLPQLLTDQISESKPEHLENASAVSQT